MVGTVREPEATGGIPSTGCGFCTAAPRGTVTAVEGDGLPPRGFDLPTERGTNAKDMSQVECSLS